MRLGALMPMSRAKGAASRGDKHPAAMGGAGAATMCMSHVLSAMMRHRSPADVLREV